MADKVLDDLESLRTDVARAMRWLRDAAVEADRLDSVYNDNSDFYAKAATRLWEMEISSRDLERQLADLYSSIRVNSS